MQKNRSLVFVAVLMTFVVVLPAAAAEGSGQMRFMGVPVMPGGVVMGDRIVYEGGTVVVVPAAAESFDSCPSGWLCLFEDIIWGGSQFQTNTTTWVNLANYGFNESTSSWRNRKNVDGQLAVNANGGGSKLCLNNNSYSSTMPAGWDDVASSVRVRDASTYC